ncbi:Glucose-6-phosphate translocase, partial [Stegodyphus mimosarum]
MRMAPLRQNTETRSISVLMGIWFLFFSVVSSASIQPQPSRSTAFEDKKTEKQATIHYLLSDPFMWLLSLCFMTVLCAKSTAIDWGQVYLINEKKQYQYVASAFTSSVESGGFLGRIAA